MTAIKFVDHTPEDVLLWMTAPSPAGPFDSTVRMWNACIDILAQQGYVQRAQDEHQHVTVTPAGEARAAELRDSDREDQP